MSSVCRARRWSHLALLNLVNIAQTPEGSLTQNLPMSLASWYRYKADQCARLAIDAIDPRKRSDFESERKLWLQISEQIEMDEESDVRTSDPLINRPG
jgi:hypothetical protein